MKTILYNTTTEAFESKVIDGVYNEIYNSALSLVLGWLPEHILQLTVVEPIAPTYDPEIQKLVSNKVIDLIAGEYRTEWTVVDKTEAELIADIDAAASAADFGVEQVAEQQLKTERIEQIRTDIGLLTDEEAFDVKSLYKPYKVGIELTTGERFYYPLDDKLYKVIGATHTTQLDWKPSEAVSLYEHVYVIPPGDLCDTSPLWDTNNWGQYTVGYHVRHNDAVYQAINTTHTWIAPAKTGDGAISWEWVKDCN